MKLDLSSYTPYGVEQIERASRDEIAARQTARIKATLARVYDNVPAYRNKFDAARVHPSDFSALEDLAKFPFTTKQDLRDNYPFGMFAVPREQVLRLHASSGTTGKATVVGYTRNDLDIWADLVARCIRTSGGRRRHTATNSMPRACTPVISVRSRTLPNFRSRPSRICATIIHSACSPCRASRSCAFMPRRGPPVKRRWSAIPATTSTSGPIWSRAASAPAVAAPACACMWRRDMGYSPVGLACTTAPSAWAAPSFRWVPA